jgi:NAD(P)-dependent dehydrogenase (short-subunit alcohol dehydrogenase family)
MTSDTNKRTVLLTGASGILGSEIARRLAADGFRLILTDLADPAGLALELGGSVIDHQPCDLLSVETVDRFTTGLLAKHQIDILINNAAIQTQYSLNDFSADTLRLFNRVNVEAAFQLSKAVSAGMAERKWGRIVNLVSGQGWRPVPGFIGYVTSKMGLVGLTRALAFALADDGITVNGITPSATQTPANKDVLPEAVWAGVRERQAIHRSATSDDLVGVIAFLLSDDARFITGQTLFADGGGTIV